MSKTYYYFAASLPMLNFEASPPISCEEFLETAQRLMDSCDYQLIKSLFEEDEGKASCSGDRTYLAWSCFNRGFTNELAWFRAERAHKDPSKFIRGQRDPQPLYSDILQQVIKISNFLEAERLIDRTRWQFLDDLEGGQFYNLDYLVVYAMKLKILERHSHINSTKGREIFENIKDVDYSQVLEN